MSYEVAAEFRIARSLVITWFKNKQQITQMAAGRLSSKLTKIRPSTKHSELFEALFTKFKACRTRGYRVDFSWLFSRARKIKAEQTNDPNATMRVHVIVTFLKRYKVRMRTKQRSKKESKESHEPELKKWHATTREKLIRVGRNDGYDEKWGRFVPLQRYNVDQCPLPFVFSGNRMYEHYDDGVDQNRVKVWISQPGAGLEKRQCTLQICIRAEGEQPRIAVIFRGKGFVGQDERLSYHPDVDVYFQPNAWADTKFSVEWAEKTLAPVVKDTERFVLFCDNLSCQKSNEFKEAVSSKKGIVWYGLPNTTDLWQPIDSGPGYLVKVLVKQSQSRWLEDDENSELWYGHSKGFSAKDRRILITRWVGEAWKKFCSAEYDEFRLKCWQKTGCLITADGSDDHLIQPEGLKDYVVPPPSLLEPSPRPPEESPFADVEEFPEDQETGEREEEPIEVNDIDDSQLPEDTEIDRDFTHEFVGKNIKALYEDGWAVGTILYYNIAFEKFKVQYENDADFIGPEEIDGVEVVLL